MMLSYCLVGLASYCSNASGTKWYVDDSPHLVKKHILTSFQMNPLFLFVVSSKQVKIPSLLRFNIHSKSRFKYVFLEQARWVKTVNISRRIAKSLWDKTVGSERAALAVRKSGSLSTGSPVGSLELTSLTGLNVQSGHCNDPQHRVRAVSM
jgi:hypothetical protein